MSAPDMPNPRKLADADAGAVLREPSLNYEDLPPRAFRSDTVGIFAVLFLAGITQLVTTEPGSVRSQVSPVVATIWSLTLAVFGAMGVVSVYLPRRFGFLGVGLHLAARLALGFGALTYAVAVTNTLGVRGSSALVALTFVGITVLCWRAAFVIYRWLQAQQRAVAAVLVVQDERHVREDETQ